VTASKSDNKEELGGITVTKKTYIQPLKPEIPETEKKK